MIERRYGTYIACNYTIPSTMALAAWATLHKIPNLILPSKYHSTVLYSRNQISEFHRDIENNPNWFFSPKALRLFPARGPKAKKGSMALVIELNAPQLINLHIRCRVVGGTHDYDDYLPHITLSYNVPKDFDHQKIRLPLVDLEVEKVYGEPLDLNWSAK